MLVAADIIHKHACNMQMAIALMMLVIACKVSRLPQLYDTFELFQLIGVLRSDAAASLMRCFEVRKGQPRLGPRGAAS